MHDGHEPRGPVVVVVVQPERPLAACVRQPKKHFYVLPLIAQSPAEALDVAVLDGPACPNEVQMRSMSASSQIHRLRSELFRIFRIEAMAGLCRSASAGR